MPNLISIIDYKAGNLGSVEHAITHLGYNAEITTNISKILDSDGIILPGVGAFGDCMENLRTSGYIENKLFEEIVKNKIPFLGICIGLQLLFEESEEMGIHKGLGIIKGKVLRFPLDFKCPQIGWNNISINDSECFLFNGILNGSFVI